ncbi:YqaJ viral recombinase family protein [Paenarthrobacter nicotinovorans]|uniref:YqaJ viral recombinase family nuclease n=1 Tax=Paenarthrobacter nicotinovorans TaxID=29320 RepID=UPI0037FEEBCD
MTYTVLDPAPDTAHWLRMRKQGLGASDSAAVLGLSKWGTALTVYKDKLSDSIDDTMSDRQDWGHRLEEPIAQWVRERKGLDVRKSPGLIRSEEFPWLLATPDRTIIEGDVVVPLEIKSSDAFMLDAWKEGIPLNYQIQIQQQILIMGAPHGYLVVLHGGNTPEFYPVEADHEFHEMLIRLTRDFWENHVLAGVAPEPTISDDLNATYKGVLGQQAVIPDDIWVMLEQRDVEANDMNYLKKRVDAFTKHIALFAGEATSLVRDGREAYTYKRQNGQRQTNFDLLYEKWPDAYAACVSQPSHRVLRKVKEKP